MYYLKLFLVLFVVVAIFCAITPSAYAVQPDGVGQGKPPDHSHKGKAVTNSDPDDNGKGPDRGDGTVDKEDWNNGCGNDDDRDDDNEGWCGKEKPVTPPPCGPRCEGLPPLTIPVKVRHNCTLRVYGSTPEIFPGTVDVRNPANEEFVLAEANGFIEFHASEGTPLTILWWNPTLGHEYSEVTSFVCVGTIVLYEPVQMGKEIW